MFANKLLGALYRMLSLSDTTVRQYRKKNGKVSIRLRSHLLIESTESFSLTAYLKDIRCYLTFPNEEPWMFKDVAVSPDCICSTDSFMVHDLTASGEKSIRDICDTVGNLRLDYHISFTGHPSEEPSSKSYVVPIIRRKTAYGP